MKILLLFVAVAAGLSAQSPAVNPGGILNHFSYALPGMPNGGIAQGSIFDIYGARIGPAALTQATGFPLPTQLGNTSVQVTVGGTTVDVFLFFVSSGQIVGLLPSRTPVGTGTLVVTVNGQRSTAAPITVAARSLGILTLAQNGLGPAVMQLSNSAGEVILSDFDRPAQPGQVGVFYGTGLGPVPFDESRGAPLLNLEPPIRAFVDGIEARVRFQGRVPGLAGLDQINLEIPMGVSGCRVAVWFLTGTVVSNFTTISISDKPCPQPSSTGGGGGGTGTLRSAGVELIRAKQKLNLGPGNTIDLTTDMGAAAFSLIDLSKIPPSTTTPAGVQIGECYVAPLLDQPRGPDNDSITYLDAGPTITIRGPNGIKQLAKSAPGYGAQLGSTAFPGQVPVPPPPYLSPGEYTIDNGPGGPGVPPFTVTLPLPSPEFSWTNADQVSPIQRSQGLEITWSGGDPNGWVDIAATSSLRASATQPVNAGGTFSCRVRASLGRYRVRPEILLYLPPSATQASGIPTGALAVVNSTLKDIPLSGFTMPTAFFGISIARSVEIR
jgi:uncharacterized protein (TIGR03437 family)